MYLLIFDFSHHTAVPVLDRYNLGITQQSKVDGYVRVLLCILDLFRELVTEPPDFKLSTPAVAGDCSVALTQEYQLLSRVHGVFKLDCTAFHAVIVDLTVT